MQLTLHNIGKIEHAVVDLEGITVIAGANDTGKSTVGKVLYCIFNGLNNIEKKLENERMASLDRALDPLYRTLFLIDNEYEGVGSLTEYFSNHLENYSDRKIFLDDLKRILTSDDFACFEEEELSKVADAVYEVAVVTDGGILKRVLSNRLRAEFNSQINNVYAEKEGFVDLRIRGELSTLTIQDNIVRSMNIRHSLTTEAVYIDDPFVLDEIASLRLGRNHLDHRLHLRSKLAKPLRNEGVIDEIIVSNKLVSIMKKLDEVCAGDITRKGSSRFGYRKPGTGKDIDVRNISTGLKTFVIIKMLLENGSLTQNGTIVLDEPEIHLHPEWQLIFAELIVLIQKEFDMHILLNTHSPYFLNAIEVYSLKYGIDDKCRYYLAEDAGLTSTLNDVTGNLEAIYEKLARPFQTLENEAYRYDEDE